MQDQSLRDKYINKTTRAKLDINSKLNLDYSTNEKIRKVSSIIKKIFRFAIILILPMLLFVVLVIWRYKMGAVTPSEEVQMFSQWNNSNILMIFAIIWMFNLRQNRVPIPRGKWGS